jgi:hypothetical protein
MKRAVRAIGLFGLLTAIYFATYSGWPVSGDELVMFDGAHSFYRNGSLELAYFSKLRPYFPPPFDEDRPVIWLDVEPLQAYAAGVLMWIAARLPDVGLVHAAWSLNIWVTALTAVVLYYYGVALGYRDRTALAVALTFGVATMPWPYSQMFFREPLFALLALTCAYALTRASYSPHPEGEVSGVRVKPLLFAAFAFTAMILTKGVGLVLVPALLLIMLPDPRAARWLIRWRVMIIAVVAVLFVAALILVYREIVPSVRFRYVWAWLNSLNFTHLPTAIAADLISPGFSLWVFSPVLLAGIVGAHLLLKTRRLREFLVPLAMAASIIVGYGLFHGENWYGGLGWGPRYLLPVIPFLALWLLPVVERLLSGRAPTWARSLAAALIAQSILMQVIGVIVPVETHGVYLHRESQQFDRVIAAWHDGTWNPLYAPPIVNAHQSSTIRPHIAWIVNSGGGVVLVLCVITAVLGAVALTSPPKSPSPLRREEDFNVHRLPLSIVWRGGRGVRSALLISSILLMAYVGLRSLQHDPRFGGDDPVLWQTLAQINAQAKPGDAVILNDGAYSNFFMNYYRGLFPIYLMPDAPGERTDPGKQPLVISDNPEAQAHAYTWVLLSRLAKHTTRWWFVTEFTPFSAGRTRPTEHFLVRHYFPVREEIAEPTLRLILFAAFDAPSERTLPARTVNANFGAATLVGFDLPGGNEITPGSILPVSLVWQHDGWPANLAPFDYGVNVSLINTEGVVVAQRAGSPVGSFGAMSRWTPEKLYRDNHGLELRPDLPPGEYKLTVLLYDWRNNTRLPVRSVEGGADHVVLATIRVAHQTQ